jgi:preprotein translocase subunit YajC
MGQGSEEGGGGYSFFIFLGLFFVIIYFFMIRPQTKKAKEQKNFLSEIQKGDRVVTVGGIHGKVLSVDDDTYLLEVDTNTKLRIEKSVVSLDFTKNLRQRTGKQDEGKDDKK